MTKPTHTPISQVTDVNMPTDAARRFFSNVIRDLVDRKGFNVTIGGDGSVEVLKDFEIIHQSRVSIPLLDGVKPMEYIVGALRALNDRKIPNGLKIKDPDLRISVYTTVFDGGVFEVESVENFTIGIYGSEISPEATEKGGYVVLKPKYKD